MGVTIYNWPNFDTSKEYTDERYLGVHTGMPCWPNWNYNPNCANNGGCCGGWGDAGVDSVKIEPEGAFEWCGWTEQNQRGDSECYKTSQSKIRLQNRVWSRSVKKVCGHSSNIWDYECNYQPNETRMVGDCTSGSDCWKLQRETCKIADLGANWQCKKWCGNNPSECPTAIYNYCNSLDIDTIVNDSICSQFKTNMIQDKCTKNSGLFGAAACKNYCQNKPTECTASAQNYCGTTFNQTCKDFCKNNIQICTEPIKNYCKSHTIKGDPYCQEILQNELMRGQHNTEMERYCNAEGQNDLSKISESTPQNAFYNSDVLTNPICACMDRQLINKKFDYIKNNQVLKSSYTGSPECWYNNCKVGGVYEPKKPDCKSIYCNQQFNGPVDLAFMKDVKIENNCPGALTTGAANSDGSQSDNPIFTEKNDCQMSAWSDCSQKCGEGTQTREVIADPHNGGQPCGPLVQKCSSSCKTLQEQLKNRYFNFNDLDKNNKILLIVIVVIIIIIIM
jgi:hypothetical protein